MDELQPDLKELQETMNRLSILNADFEGKVIVSKWWVAFLLLSMDGLHLAQSARRKADTIWSNANRIPQSGDALFVIDNVIMTLTYLCE